jgi:hypothetical protein
MKERVNVMTNKVLVSTLALMLAAGGGAAWAQGTGGTEKQGGAAMQSQTGGSTAGATTQTQAQTPSGDQSMQPGKKRTQSRQPGKQIGQAGEENAPSGTQTRHNMGGMKRGQAEPSGEKQGRGSMQSQTSPTKNQGQGAMESQASPSNRSSTTGMQGSTTGKPQGTSESASLTSEQKSRITDVIKKEKIHPEANVNFSVSVGTEVPRTVRLHRLPREIVEVEPKWRAYEFVLVGDEIVIVNPRNFEIVAVMPA